MSLPAVGRAAVNDGQFFRRIGGQTSFTVRSYDRVVQWMADNWPRGAKWPRDIERPARTEVSTDREAEVEAAAEVAA